MQLRTGGRSALRDGRYGRPGTDTGGDVIGRWPARIFLIALGLQLFHQLEHVIQVVQTKVLGSTAAHGIAGAAVDKEWVHLVYNASLLAMLLAVAFMVRSHWASPEVRAGRGWWRLFALGVGLQALDVGEQVVKVIQHVTTGVDPALGILGRHADPLWLHATINSVVLAGMLCGLLALKEAGAFWIQATQVRIRKRIPARSATVGMLVLTLVGSGLTMSPLTSARAASRDDRDTKSEFRDLTQDARGKGKKERDASVKELDLGDGVSAGVVPDRRAKNSEAPSRPRGQLSMSASAQPAPSPSTGYPIPATNGSVFYWASADKPMYAGSPIQYERWSDIDSGDTYSVEVTGPCRYKWTRSFTNNNDPFYNAMGSFWFSTTLPVDACTGTYQVTMTDSNSQYIEPGVSSFEVEDGIPAAQAFGSGSSMHAMNPTVSRGDPVNTYTGSYHTSAVDAALGGSAPRFAFVRSYNSADTTTGPLGPGWTHSYNTHVVPGTIGKGKTAINIVTAYVEDGQQFIFRQQADGTYVGGRGVTGKLFAVSSGGWRLVRRDQTEYVFDSTGRMTSLREPNGRGFTFSYVSGALTSIADPAGRNVTLAYSNGLLTSLTLPDGRSVTYGYTGGRLASVMNVGGKETKFTYDSSGRLASIVEPNGATLIQNVYGADGRVTQQTNALGQLVKYSWNANTKTSTFTDARGGTWKDKYNGGAILSQTDPLGKEVASPHDINFNRLELIDLAPKKTTDRFVYDGAGNLTKHTVIIPWPGTSATHTYAYDAQNRLTSYIDPKGNTTTYDYDASGNLIKITEPGTTITQFGYDLSSGLLTSVTDPRGKTTTLAYDESGNLAKTTSPLGSVVTMGYDGSGRMTSRVDPRGNELGTNPADFRFTFAYDAANNLVSRTDPLGNQTSRSYSSEGAVVSTTDAKGRTRTYDYDAAHRLVSVTAPDGTVTSYAYDASGNLIRRTDANNHVTTYEYDAANRLIKATSPAGQVSTYGYDRNGNVTEVIDPKGNATSDPADGKTTYAYDNLDRLLSINYSDQTSDVTLTYDANSNLTKMIDGLGTETYTYDSLDRLTVAQRGTSAMRYAYDAAGNIVTRTHPDFTAVGYAYDADSRLSSVTAGTAVTNYEYDPAANLVKTTLPNGDVSSRAYDRAGRLTDVTNANGPSVLSSAAYVLDAVGNPTAVTAADGSKTTYSYDARDRLIEACFQASCAAATDPFIRYVYDAVGNRTAEDRPEGTTTYSYDVADRLLSTTGPAGATAYEHDANGNMTKAGSRAFAYDLANRVSSTTKDAQTTTYQYDGVGKRLRATDGAITNYVWDATTPVPEVVTERDGSGGLLRRYVHGNDLVSMTTGGSDYIFHTDRLGSVTDVTNGAGAPQWSYSYEPFGTMKTKNKIDPLAPDNPMGFTGEYLDSTGLYHLRARQYDPTIGRFLSNDPLAPALTDPYVASYVYVKNRPTVLIDPLGLCGITDLLDCATDLGHDLGGVADRAGEDIADATRYVAGGVADAVETVGHAAYEAFKASCQIDLFRDAGDLIGFFGESQYSSAQNAAVKATSRFGPPTVARIFNAMQSGNVGGFFQKKIPFVVKYAKVWNVATGVATVYNLGCRSVG